jgi:hypothetical protein
MQLRQHGRGVDLVGDDRVIDNELSLVVHCEQHHDVRYDVILHDEEWQLELQRDIVRGNDLRVDDRHLDQLVRNEQSHDRLGSGDVDWHNVVDHGRRHDHHHGLDDLRNHRVDQLVIDEWSYDEREHHRLDDFGNDGLDQLVIDEWSHDKRSHHLLDHERRLQQPLVRCSPTESGRCGTGRGGHRRF